MNYLFDKRASKYVIDEQRMLYDARKILYLRVVWNGTTSRSVRALFRPVIRDQKASHHWDDDNDHDEKRRKSSAAYLCNSLGLQ